MGHASCALVLAFCDRIRENRVPQLKSLQKHLDAHGPQRRRRDARKESCVGRITARLALMLSMLAVGVMAIAGAAVTTASGAAPAATKAGPATAKAWKQILAKGKEEGQATIYSSQNPIYLADFAAGVKKKFGISVTINRQIDSVLGTQITAEEGANSLKADVWITASLPHVLGAHKNGWVTDAVGPDLYKKAYDRKVYAKPAKAFVVGAALL